MVRPDKDHSTGSNAFFADVCNDPAIFQAMMDNIFQDLLDQGVIVYLDDVLIYSESKEKPRDYSAKW